MLNRKNVLLGPIVQNDEDESLVVMSSKHYLKPDKYQTTFLELKWIKNGAAYS